MVGVSCALVGGGEEDERFRAPAEPGPVRGPRLPATFAVALPRCPVRGSVPRMDGSVVSLLNSVLEGELRRGTLLVDGIVSWGTAPPASDSAGVSEHRWGSDTHRSLV